MSDVEGVAENIKITLEQNPSDLAESEDGKYSEVIFLIFKVCLSHLHFWYYKTNFEIK